MQLRILHQLKPSGNVVQYFRRHYSIPRSLPGPPQIKELKGHEGSSAAKSWISEFRKHDLPRDLVQWTFSRSSGPGGQNVNKVNTKATGKCAISSWWIPPWAQDYLRRSTAYVGSHDVLQVSSTTHRSQGQNVDECLRKLHEIIVTASQAPIKNEPSEEQIARVDTFVRVEKARRRKEKDLRSQLKRSRSRKFDE